MFLGINNNFSFYEFSNLSFFVFVFTTLMKKISILNIFSTDLILLQINLGNTANLNSNLCRRGGGRYSQIFLGRGKNLIWGTWHFIGGLDNHLETMLYCYSCKFEWLYIPNNLKDIKRSYIGWYDKLQNLFPINGKLQLPLLFNGSIRLVFETAFISEQIAENRFEALLEISDKFITKFNVFCYIILQFRLKTVWKISKPYRMALTVAK